MKKYTVNFCQEYAQNIGVTIQVETSLSFEELENEISEISSKWTRLGRLSEKELISSGEIVGYVKGTYSTWDGDSEPFSEVSVSLEEIDFNINEIEDSLNTFETLIEVPQVECSGKWYQGDNIGEMFIKMSLSEGVLTGNGVDSIGEYKIHGYLAGNYISFNKQYIGKHSLLYFGKFDSESKKWQGEWIIVKSGTTGRFELNIPSTIFSK